MRFAIVLVVCACGEPVRAPVEHGAITVVVTRERALVPDAIVVFHDADGIERASGKTDQDGVFGGEIFAGGMVTVVDPRLPTSLITITEVAPSSEPLEVPLEVLPGQGVTSGMLRVDAPPGALPSGTNYFAIATACGDHAFDALPAVVPISQACTREGGIPVIVTAMEPPGSLESPGKSLAFAGAIVTPDAAGNASYTPTAWSTTCAQVAVTRPAELEIGVALYPRLGDNTFRVWPDFCPSSIERVAVLDFGEGLDVEAFGYVFGSLKSAFVTRRLSVVPAAVTVAEADILVGDAELGHFDVAGARWTSDSALAVADLVVARFTLAIEEPPHTVSWRVVAPSWTTEVTLPSLPERAGTWTPITHHHGFDLHYIDATWLDGYESVPFQLPAVGERAMRTTQPPDTSLREYHEQFYPSS